jgi:hypothetical protein
VCVGMPACACIHVSVLWRARACLCMLRSPITLELFDDPVVAEDGVTYERSALEKYWARSAKPLSPLTRTELTSKALYANRAMKSVCDEFRAKLRRARLVEHEPAELLIAALLAPPTPCAAPHPGTAVGAKKRPRAALEANMLPGAGGLRGGASKRSCVTM